MPNWCSCVLEVWGPPDEIDYFRRVHTAQRRGYEDAGYAEEGELCVANSLWLTDFYGEAIQRLGMKWGTRDSRSDHVGEGALIYSFQTPWDPPTKWLISITALFPSLEMLLTWVEHGNKFCGRLNERGYLEHFEYSPDNNELPGWIQDEIIENYAASEMFEPSEEDLEAARETMPA